MNTAVLVMMTVYAPVRYLFHGTEMGPAKVKPE